MECNERETCPYHADKQQDGHDQDSAGDCQRQEQCGHGHTAGVVETPDNRTTGHGRGHQPIDSAAAVDGKVQGVDGQEQRALA